jgi:hypothetical protein
VRIVADEAFDSGSLLEAADLLFDFPTLATMRTAARGFGRPGAADAVAELVLAMAEHAALPAPEQIDRLSRAGAVAS